MNKNNKKAEKILESLAKESRASKKFRKTLLSQLKQTHRVAQNKESKKTFWVMHRQIAGVFAVFILASVFLLSTKVTTTSPSIPYKSSEVNYERPPSTILEKDTDDAITFPTEDSPDSYSDSGGHQEASKQISEPIPETESDSSLETYNQLQIEIEADEEADQEESNYAPNDNLEEEIDALQKEYDDPNTSKERRSEIEKELAEKKEQLES